MMNGVVMKTVEVFMKHDDRASFTILDENGNEVFEQNSDYLPYLGIFGGDDTSLKIDNETGKIIGWVPITKEHIEARESVKF